jgi:hypothetical protein
MMREFTGGKSLILKIENAIRGRHLEAGVSETARRWQGVPSARQDDANHVRLGLSSGVREWWRQRLRLETGVSDRQFLGQEQR